MSIKYSHIQEDINYCVGDHVGQWYTFQPGEIAIKLDYLKTRRPTTVT